MAKLIMGYWDCPVCGKKEITGDVMNCPACGRARGDVIFYMKGGEGPREADQRTDLEYLSQEKAAQIGDDPDWYCSFCNSLNNARASFCSNCGATKAASEANYFDIERKKKEADAARQAAAQAAAAPARPAPKASRRPLLILLAVIIAVAGFLIYRNGTTTRGDLQVTEAGWSRAVQIEENRQKTGSGWSVPEGAEVTGQKQEIYTYNQVFSHYENRRVTRYERVLDHYEEYYEYVNKGNGTFEEVPRQRPVYVDKPVETTVREPQYISVPQYETKYYYTYWQWEPSRVAEASGSDRSPAWPEFTLAENEREGQRTERYTFTVTDAKGQSSSYAMTEDVWNQYPVGSGLSISAKRNGTDVWIVDGSGNKVSQLTPIR